MTSDSGIASWPVEAEGKGLWALPFCVPHGHCWLEGHKMNPLLPLIWGGCGVVIVVAAARSRHSQRAARTGELAVGALYLGGGAVVNALLVAAGEDYHDFADRSSISFVRDT